MKDHPEGIWAPTVSPRVRRAVRDYDAKRMLSNGREYGASVRDFSLEGQTAREIELHADAFGCRKREDVLKHPGDNLPIHDRNGHTIPLVSYVCPDGGALRVKPEGDSTNRYDKKPEATKALRYPAESPYRNFSDEVVKVDNQGAAIPKWPKDLNRVYSDPARQRAFITGWALDAHTDIRVESQ